MNFNENVSIVYCFSSDLSVLFIMEIGGTMM